MLANFAIETVQSLKRSDGKLHGIKCAWTCVRAWISSIAILGPRDDKDLFFRPLAPTLERRSDFSVSWSFYRRYDALDGWSARRKAATYTQDNINTE
jgi:hypothetical protein